MIDILYKFPASCPLNEIGYKPRPGQLGDIYLRRLGLSARESWRTAEIVDEDHVLSSLECKAALICISSDEVATKLDRFRFVNNILRSSNFDLCDGPLGMTTFSVPLSNLHDTIQKIILTNHLFAMSSGTIEDFSSIQEAAQNTSTLGRIIDGTSSPGFLLVRGAETDERLINLIISKRWP